MMEQVHQKSIQILLRIRDITMSPQAVRILLMRSRARPKSIEAIVVPLSVTFAGSAQKLCTRLDASANGRLRACNDGTLELSTGIAAVSSSKLKVLMTPS